MKLKNRKQDKNVQDALNMNDNPLRPSLRARFKKRMKPDRFGWDDVAQQIIGAFIFSAPFAVTEEVWTLALHMSIPRTIFLFCLTVFISTLIFYYTKFQKLAMEEFKPLHVPKRILSLFIISYGAAFMVLWMFGIIGEISDPLWITKLIVFVSFFSTMGAATADIIK